MKKTTAYILCISLVIGIMCGFSLQASADENDNSYMEFLSVMGVISNDYAANSEISVTREEFALYAARAIGINEYENRDKRYFRDISTDSPGAGAINSLADMGCITVGSDNLFRPNDLIGINEACKILIGMLGYGRYAEAAGGYPGGYIKAAQKTKIMTGVGEQMTLRSISRLIVNALEANIAEISSVSSDKAVYSPSAEETLLSVHHSIYTVCGTLESVYGASVSGVYSDRNKAIIDGEIYMTAEGANTDECLGDYVKAYYCRERKTDMPEIIYTKPYFDRCHEVIDISSIESYNDYTIRYRHGNSVKTVSFDKQTSVTYNGAPLESGINATFNSLTDGKIILKEGRRGGKYDNAIIWDYTDFILGQKSQDRDVLYSKYSPPIDCEEYDSVVVKNKLGDAISLNDLDRMNVLSVARSKNNRCLNIIVSDETMTAEVNSVNNDADTFFVEINGREYDAADVCLDYLRKNLRAGGKYKLYIDAFDKIAFCDSADSDSYSIGYLVNCCFDEKSLKDKLEARIFTSDNKMVVTKFADSVKVDGIKMTDLKMVNNAIPKDLLPGGKIPEFQTQLIRYRLDENGDIDFLDTFNVSDKEDPHSSLTRLAPQQILKYGASRFGTKITINGYASTVVFAPADNDAENAEEKEFDFVNLWNAELTGDTEYNVESYRLNTDNDFADYVIVRGGEQGGNKGVVILVDKIYERRDEDGEWVKVLRGLDRNKSAIVEYEIPDTTDVSGIEQGDLVRCSKNSRGELAKAPILYDISIGGEPTWAGVTDSVCWYASNYYQEFMLSYGYVSDKSERMVRFGYKSKDGYDEEYNVSSIPIMVYDPTKRFNKVYFGTMNDIYDYKSSGENCSKIILHTVYQNGACAVIYNNTK